MDINFLSPCLGWKRYRERRAGMLFGPAFVSTHGPDSITSERGLEGKKG